MLPGNASAVPWNRYQSEPGVNDVEAGALDSASSGPSPISVEGADSKECEKADVVRLESEMGLLDVEAMAGCSYLVHGCNDGKGLCVPPSFNLVLDLDDGWLMKSSFGDVSMVA